MQWMKRISIGMLCGLMITMGSLTVAGCKGGQTSLNVAKFVQNETPAIESAADAIATAVATLLPADAILTNAALATFNATLNSVDAVAKAYIANPSPSALTNLENALVAVQNSIGTTIASLGKLGIPSDVLLTITGGVNFATTIILALLGAVQSVSTKAQLDNMRSLETVKVASLRPFMDRNAAEQIAAANHVTVGQYFATEYQMGF